MFRSQSGHRELEITLGDRFAKVPNRERVARVSETGEGFPKHKRKTRGLAARGFFKSANRPEDYLIFASLNWTCLRTTGSYLRNSSFSVVLRGFFFAT